MMIDFIFSIRIGMDDSPENHKQIANFAQRLRNATYSHDSLLKLLDILNIGFKGFATQRITHSADSFDFFHPKRTSHGKWSLNDQELRSKSRVFIKLENQDIKAVVRTTNKVTAIRIEPEGVEFPVNSSLLLSWQ